ncbi:butyrophilin subfamily 3 member A2-like, partial [Nelusetta ayraudi]|uniref:butyrophilin subfamily 3 member A2-like n=1 Tax=Nelusetta ayraudi TaxID=303726 RepID=UPI003F71EFAD
MLSFTHLSQLDIKSSKSSSSKQLLNLLSTLLQTQLHGSYQESLSESKNIANTSRHTNLERIPSLCLRTDGTQPSSASDFLGQLHIVVPPTMILTCFVALLPWLCSSAPTGNAIKVSVSSLVPVRTGQSTTLPCWLDPPQSAEALEIQWYRSDKDDSYIMVYMERKIVYAGQNTPYQGRVSFGTKDAASGGLASGDVSLQLVNVSVEDAAKYTCHVSRNQDEDIAVITLAVSKTGGPVLLSSVWRDDNTLNVSCESGGWYPEPRLQWSDSKGALTTMRLKHSRDSSGLVSVHSWLLVSSSSKISCSVGLDGEEAKEASVYLASLSQPCDQCSAGGTGWVAFTVLLITILAALGVLCFKKRGIFSRKRKVEEKQHNGGKDEPLLGEDHSVINESNLLWAQSADRPPIGFIVVMLVDMALKQPDSSCGCGDRKTLDFLEI